MLSKSLIRFACFPFNRTTTRKLSKLLIEERKLEILTCKHLFKKDSQNAGLKFEVAYLDGQLRNEKESPVVLLLPGAPGNYMDYNRQIPDLLNSGARVIAPNFPELQDLLKYTKPKCRNSPENKSAYIRDFLSAIGVSRIDMLVTHSSAVYTGLRLFRFPDKLSIKSLVMINPLGHWHSTTRPAWFWWPINEMVNYKLGHKFLKIFGKAILDAFSPVEVPHIYAPLVGLTSIRSFNLKEAGEGYKEVAQRKPPLLFMFSDNDRLVKSKISHQMLDIFGSKKEDWWCYDEKGCLAKKGNNDNWITALNFKKGSHYSLRKHPEVVTQAIVNFLNKTTENNIPLTNKVEVTTKPKLHENLSTDSFCQKRQLDTQI